MIIPKHLNELKIPYILRIKKIELKLLRIYRNQTNGRNSYRKVKEEFKADI
jgi:hypothetical protein